MRTLTYKVFETTTKLQLFVFNLTGGVAYARRYEAGDGALARDIRLLDHGATTFSWTGNSLTRETDYLEVLRPHYNYQVVADNNNIYFERMGRLGNKEFARFNRPPIFSLNAIRPVLQPC